MRVLFSAPAYWPASAFGGPIWMARELNEGMVQRGHSVDVVTTTLLDIDTGLSSRSRVEDVHGVRVHYLATPLRYRWMGITPTLPATLARLGRPDVAHIFGFRDVVGTLTAEWCRARRIPYVFEPLGMFAPRVRKIRFKQVFDRTAARGVVRGAVVVVATSEVEREAMVAAGAPRSKVEIRGNGFPPPALLPTGLLRRELGLHSEPIVLYVGRIAAGKGVGLLLDSVRALPYAHLVLIGPDDGHGVIDAVQRAERDAATAGRIHVLGPRTRPLDLYGDADVFVLPSEGESFGMVAAEAAAAGTPVVVTDRCGVAEFLGTGALVVPARDGAALTRAIERVLRDTDLRDQLRADGLEAAARYSWPRMVERQEELYRLAMGRS
jgi:glycosyltransferase involved in cell wall biosynthesis